ncbi:MAG: hypothetical protein EXR55_02815 [Dehalococcoidia bacterium]|nr:hypothetical protein [Dehalococcoidia bacterium]
MLNIEVDDVGEASRRVAQHGGRVIRQEGMSNAVWVHPTSAHFAFIELNQPQREPSSTRESS